MNHSLYLPNRPKRAGGFALLSNKPYLKTLTSFFDPDAVIHSELPKRYFYKEPLDTGAYIKPLKQAIVKDARLCPGTRLMLILLSGMDGAGSGISITIGTIAQQMGRCRRTIVNYLNDAIRFGYLSYSRTKSSIGYYTGIKVYLKFELIRKSFKERMTSLKCLESLDVQNNAEINRCV